MKCEPSEEWATSIYNNTPSIEGTKRLLSFFLASRRICSSSCVASTEYIYTHTYMGYIYTHMGWVQVISCVILKNITLLNNML